MIDKTYNKVLSLSGIIYITITSNPMGGIDIVYDLHDENQGES